MQQLTQAGQDAVADIAQRYALSVEAVEHMLIAVNNGAGSMAQFNCSELGGSGQWMRGGMTMVGDMFNQTLKATVDRLCTELSQLLASTQVFPAAATNHIASAQWWPENLGPPISSGRQNNTRYAVFARRLALDVDGHISVYDTLDHQISGVSQQQGGADSLTFNSQFGTVSLASLPVVVGADRPSGLTVSVSTPTSAFSDPVVDAGQAVGSPVGEPVGKPVSEMAGETVLQTGTLPEVPPDNRSQPPVADNTNKRVASQDSGHDLLALIEKLAQLHEAGVLSDDEFHAKKTELLARV